jgi:putative endonuclease
MGTDNQLIGKWGEAVAVEYLKKIGYSILTRNYHTPVGEIDIVALDDDTKYARLVFVEVKTRTTSKHGFPEAAIGKKKWEHMLAAGQYYLEAHTEIKLEWCIDVVAVLGYPNLANPQIQHYENVVIDDD